MAEQTKDRWDAGLEAMRQSVELSKIGKSEETPRILDQAIALASDENRGMWVGTLCRHACVLAHAMGDVDREIRYAEQALAYTKDYRFALYNFAQLLLSGSQFGRAERYAMEAHKRSLVQETEADRDLVAAILKQWPNLRHSP